MYMVASWLRTFVTLSLKIMKTMPLFEDADTNRIVSDIKKQFEQATGTKLDKYNNRKSRTRPARNPTPAINSQA